MHFLIFRYSPSISSFPFCFRNPKYLPFNFFSCSRSSSTSSPSTLDLDRDDNLLTEQYQGGVYDAGSSHSPFASLRYTHYLKPYPSLKNPHPAFRILDIHGKLSDYYRSNSMNHGIASDATTLKRIYTSMMTLKALDHVLYNSQRQGRISFYMTSTGEEACVVASAAALSPNDPIYAQYRESGILIYRGYSIKQIMNQVFSNRLDPAKGRQMPVHYGSRQFNYLTISSPLATQLPQAAGAAYQIKLENNKKTNPEDKRIVGCYFGEGAASEGDFHAALNFAATLDCPVLFFCRNNGYAISTPVAEQYRGDGISSRGPAYGIQTYRVDGNDALASYEAVRAAREYACENNKPVLVEAMTYRMGHHSTSDDSSAYREKTELDPWADKHGPFHRLQEYMIANKFLSLPEIEKITSDIQAEILSEFKSAELEKKPSISHLFTDVYDKELPHIIEQRLLLEKLVHDYPNEFSFAKDFAKEST